VYLLTEPCTLSNRCDCCNPTHVVHLLPPVATMRSKAMVLAKKETCADLRQQLLSAEPELHASLILALHTFDSLLPNDSEALKYRAAFEECVPLTNISAATQALFLDSLDRSVSHSVLVVYTSLCVCGAVLNVLCRHPSESCVHEP
jgi:hypothetical protein